MYLYSSLAHVPGTSRDSGSMLSLYGRSCHRSARLHHRVVIINAKSALALAQWSDSTISPVALPIHPRYQIADLSDQLP